jgi:hypothetical protein
MTLTPLQLSHLDWAEQLRAVGRDLDARLVIAEHLCLPTQLREHCFSVARDGLQLERWYSAWTGRTWDGSYASLKKARLSAYKVQRDRGSRAAGGTLLPPATYRVCHLLVEPRATTADVSTAQHIRWPDAVDVGHLQWGEQSPYACMYCGALLFTDEGVEDEGVIGDGRAGKYCCKKGCVACIRVRNIPPADNMYDIPCRKVCPPAVPDVPAWVTDLWLGWPGQAYGEIGLRRTAARKYSRQVHNALSLASQVRVIASLGACEWCMTHVECMLALERANCRSLRASSRAAPPSSVLRVGAPVIGACLV